MRKVAIWVLAAAFVMVAAGNVYAQGGGSKNDAEHKQIHQRVEQMLDKARAASKSDWPKVKKDLMDKWVAKFKEKGKDPAKFEDVLGKSLDKARAMPAAKYNTDKNQLASDIMKALQSGMGGGKK